MAKARVLCGGQGGSFLYGGGSWWPGIPSLIREMVQSFRETGVIEDNDDLDNLSIYQY